MTESEYKALTGVLRLLIAEVRKAKAECSDSRDRIEHLIERMRAMEQKMTALAEQLSSQRDQDIDNFQESTNCRQEEEEAG